MNDDISTIGFLNYLRRRVTIDICAEGGDDGFVYVTSTEILDSDPDGKGGVVLKLDATIEEGEMSLPASIIAMAEETPDCWELRHGGLLLRFGLAEGEPAFGTEGFFTKYPNEWEALQYEVNERDARRDAKLREQRG